MLVRWGAGVMAILWLCSCSPPEAREYQKGLREVESKHFHIAVSHFDHVLKRAPESESAIAAAREGSRIASLELKDFKKAIEYDRHLVLYSKDAAERILAQKRIATTYFENLQEYSKAANEYNKLLAMPLSTADKAKGKISLSRSYFYSEEFNQAESEIQDLLRERLDPDSRFAALALRGSILVARKDFKPAVELLRGLVKSDPERSKRENIGMQLVVSLEENHDYKEAVQVLESMKATYEPKEYIELRIKRLQEKVRNQPGARGLGRK